MADSLPSLSELGKYRKKIGNWPLLFFTLAITTATFTSNLKTDEQITSLLNFTAGCLFALALLIALLKIISAFFTHRPARGLIDGLGAGLVAGIIGGFFWLRFSQCLRISWFHSSILRRTPLLQNRPLCFIRNSCRWNHGNAV